MLGRFGRVISARVVCVRSCLTNSIDRDSTPPTSWARARIAGVDRLPRHRDERDEEREIEGGTLADRPTPTEQERGKESVANWVDRLLFSVQECSRKRSNKWPSFESDP